MVAPQESLYFQYGPDESIREYVVSFNETVLLIIEPFGQVDSFTELNQV
jgi:hypothetical protein